MRGALRARYQQDEQRDTLQDDCGGAAGVVHGGGAALVPCGRHVRRGLTLDIDRDEIVQLVREGRRSA